MNDQSSIPTNALEDADPALRLAVRILSQCYADGETLVYLG